jgi:branched-chain amino acid transport system substrate-binding protein
MGVFKAFNTVAKKAWMLTTVAIGGLIFEAPSASAQEGVTKFKVTVGQSAPMSGPAAYLGQETRIGASLAFEEASGKPEIFRRDIEVDTFDDAGDPKQAEANIQKLITQNKVLAILNYVGTPSAATLQLAEKEKVPFIGTLSGDAALRANNLRYVFNVRASYSDEISKLVETLTTIGQSKFAVLYEEGDFGKSGLAAANEALDKKKLKLVASAPFARAGTAKEVEAATDFLLKAQPDAVIMIATFGPATAAVKHAKAKRAAASFYAISFVGGKALSRDLGKQGHGVGVMAVVPSPFSPSVAVVREYQKLMQRNTKTDYSFESLEGFIGAKVLVEGLKRAGPNPDREKLAQALRSINDLDLGGFRVSFKAKPATCEISDAARPVRIVNVS